ncbi:hypothetical protein JRQ81_018998 [Phrynocephalus forsythii]|uniref:HIG1 domain-containing protein n=1 Tax=Phrynocephalus forsythii TaxID=171643 RepID=A0A9Q0XSY2_9SAUR|nr:hypothetical protein JRQ81_018998 [Phrynocephalus forsythii]
MVPFRELFLPACFGFSTAEPPGCEAPAIAGLLAHRPPGGGGRRGGALNVNGRDVIRGGGRMGVAWLLRRDPVCGRRGRGYCRVTFAGEGGGGGGGGCACRVNMSSSPESSYVSTEDPGQASKLLKKSKESPFVPIGIAGFLALAAYGLYKIRHRGDTKLSVHLIHTRVAAQGFVVGAMTCGVAYAMLRDYLAKPKP